MAALIQTEHYNEPAFINLEGFEVISQKIPSHWEMISIYDASYLMPKSWAYEGFFSDLEDQEPTAIELFLKESQISIAEEESC